MRVRDALARLAVALWIATLRTPYMQCDRRSHDGFRQFVVGVVYGLRRGVSLHGTCRHTHIVPRCLHICCALPNMRNPKEKRIGATTFRMSAHRGLCTLHRALASTEEDTQSVFWANCTSAATYLQKVHDSKMLSQNKAAASAWCSHCGWSRPKVVGLFGSRVPAGSKHSAHATTAGQTARWAWRIGPASPHITHVA